MLQSWWQKLFARKTTTIRRTGRRACKPQRNRSPLRLEALETRELLTGTWIPLDRTAPEAIGTMMLLSDGTVMAQGGLGNVVNGKYDGKSKNWYRLTPDSFGKYEQGTWSALPSMSLERLYFGSNVLPDGRVFVLGGEYSGPTGQQNWTNTGEMFDPT